MITQIAMLAGIAIRSMSIARRRWRRGEDERADAWIAPRLRAHERVARILTDAGPPAQTAPRAARAVAEELGWDVAVVWLHDPAGRTLQMHEGWVRDPALEPVLAARRGDAVLPGAGPTGRAWSEHRAVCVDVAAGEDRAVGLRTAAALPLSGAHGTVGVLELLAARRRDAVSGELAALDTIARLVGAVVSRRREDAEHVALLVSEKELRTRADRAERRATFLAEAGPLLSASLDVGSTAATAARLAVPELADFCAIDMCEDDGTLRRIAVAHVSRTRERTAWEAAHRHPAGESTARRCVATEAPVLVPCADETLVLAGLIDERQVELMRELELTTGLAVPLRAPGRVLGTLTLGTGPSGRAFGPEDLAMAEGLADRTSQAMLNARLFEGERAARAQAERAAGELAEAQERFRTAFEHAPIGVGILSVEEPDAGRWLEVNPALCEIVGYAEDELRERTVRELTHPDDREGDVEAFEAMLAGDVPELRRETRYVHANGHPVWVQLRATVVRDADGRPLHSVVQVQDITDRKRYEGQLQYLADHDALTGIFNRRRFEAELDRAVAQSRRYGETAAVLVVDLDNFKYVNDTYGHAVGDELLGRVAGALRGRLRDTDVLGRLGGDEFAAILPRVSQSDARAAAGHVLNAVRAEGNVTIGDRKVRATCSIGINTIDPTTELTAEELLVEADLAMYEAKAAGRDRVASVAPGEASRAKMKARMTWSERIRDALEHDHFELWEQPILALETGEVDRSEVLIRMLDANGDSIPPGVFLYIAERFGQIQAVDRWVIARAIRLLAERDRLIEVNLSGASITDEATIDFIAAEIANAPIDPTKLVFEVTETTAIVNVERARRFARRLSDLGCQFALDDFGAGFGSFYYLKHLPFDCVKIDGDFVKELPRSPADQLTVKAIVQIAGGLGKETVAEFVQDEDTVRLLREYGVDYAQGYHIGRPHRATQGRRPAPFRLPA